MTAAAILSIFASRCLSRHPGPSATIPSRYQGACNDVYTSLTNFEAALASTSNGSPYPVLHSTNLQTASSDLTTTLLGPNYYWASVLGSTCGAANGSASASSAHAKITQKAISTTEWDVVSILGAWAIS